MSRFFFFWWPNLFSSAVHDHIGFEFNIEKAHNLIKKGGGVTK